MGMCVHCICVQVESRAHDRLLPMKVLPLYALLSTERQAEVSTCLAISTNFLLSNVKYIRFVLFFPHHHGIIIVMLQSSHVQV